MVAGRDGEETEAVAGEIEAGAVGRAVDVRDPAGCEVLVAAARETFGRLDALVTSVGIARSQPSLQASCELWQETLTVNLT